MWGQKTPPTLGTQMPTAQGNTASDKSSKATNSLMTGLGSLAGGIAGKIKSGKSTGTKPGGNDTSMTE